VRADLHLKINTSDDRNCYCPTLAADAGGIVAIEGIAKKNCRERGAKLTD
jgi:hypothetical protein